MNEPGRFHCKKQNLHQKKFGPGTKKTLHAVSRSAVESPENVHSRGRKAQIISGGYIAHFFFSAISNAEIEDVYGRPQGSTRQRWTCPPAGLRSVSVAFPARKKRKKSA